MVPRGASASDLDEPIDIQLKDASLRETLASFATIAGTKVVIDPALEGVVTIHLQNTPVRAALDAICRMEGCRWELVEAAEGPVLRFTPSGQG
jgi:type II secretory pathway component GspD/PulD (secretin)